MATNIWRTLTCGLHTLLLSLLISLRLRWIATSNYAHIFFTGGVSTSSQGRCATGETHQMMSSFLFDLQVPPERKKKLGRRRSVPPFEKCASWKTTFLSDFMLKVPGSISSFTMVVVSIFFLEPWGKRSNLMFFFQLDWHHLTFIVFHKFQRSFNDMLMVSEWF